MSCAMLLEQISLVSIQNKRFHLTSLAFSVLILFLAEEERGRVSVVLVVLAHPLMSLLPNE